MNNINLRTDLRISYIKDIGFSYIEQGDYYVMNDLIISKNAIITLNEKDWSSLIYLSSRIISIRSKNKHVNAH